MMLRFDIFIELHGELDCMLTLLYLYFVFSYFCYKTSLCTCIMRLCDYGDSEKEFNRAD